MLLPLLTVVSDVLSGLKDREKKEEKDEEMGPDSMSIHHAWPQIRLCFQFCQF